jgi:UDP-3-O-[3-hydroxymyristoyl] glucosamine N-acyltransferase
MKDKITKVKFHNGNEEIVISSNCVEIINSYSEEKKNEIKDMEFVCYYNDVKDVRESQKVVAVKEEDKVEGKKYEITNIQHPDYSFLHRIRALRDIPRFGVKAGDLGGWVGNEDNLSQDGDCWIGGNAEVYENALVYGNAQIGVNAQVTEYAWVFGNAQILGYAQVCGNARVGGSNSICSGIVTE